jgi:hypothetical protein
MSADDFGQPVPYSEYSGTPLNDSTALIKVLERIAIAQEALVEQGKKLVKNSEDTLGVSRSSLFETRAHTDYLQRSELKRDKIDALTSLFYAHTFKRDGFELVIDTNNGVYRTIPVEQEKWKADTEEIREAGERLRKALDKFTVEGPKLT